MFVCISGNSFPTVSSYEDSQSLRQNTDKELPVCLLSTESAVSGSDRFVILQAEKLAIVKRTFSCYWVYVWDTKVREAKGKIAGCHIRATAETKQRARTPTEQTAWLLAHLPSISEAKRQPLTGSDLDRWMTRHMFVCCCEGQTAVWDFTNRLWNHKRSPELLHLQAAPERKQNLARHRKPLITPFMDHTIGPTIKSRKLEDALSFTVK